MGTHPIFESDFDCLTEMSENCATKSCGAVPTELTVEDMKKAITERFSPIDHLEVDDLGTCGTSYKVIIVSSIFEGKKTLDKHRFVNEKLKEEINQLHAFSQKTFTPEQWAKQKAKNSS